MGAVGEVDGFIAMISDVSDHKRAEAEKGKAPEQRESSA